ncbi:MAG: HPr family phosphocarrier protein [Nitratireductor sp.]|nr:HPr family phosphocarrier protein [Nitratireductor sp.]
MSRASSCKGNSGVGGRPEGDDPGAGSKAGGDKALRAKPAVRTIAIVNKRGLHARASAKFVQCVEKFDAEVSVSRDDYTVGGTSIMGLMMLAACNGSEITVAAHGPQADEVLEALETLIADRFGEGE